MQVPVQRCPECSGQLQQRDHETVCGDCGLVHSDERIDHSAELGSPEGEPSKRRTGAPLTRTRHDRGLSTEIGFGTGSELTGARQRQLLRMRRQHNRARLSSKRERNRAYALTEIQRIIGALGLSESLSEQACALFKSAQSNDLLAGRSLEGFAAASVYAVCRVRSLARTMDEIVTVARAERSELKAAYGAMNSELGLPVGPIDPSEYLPRYASELDLAPDVEGRAREYISALKGGRRLGGKNPSGVAAACLYKAAYDLGVDVTQTAAADVANVSRMTIRSTVKDLKEIDLRN